MWRRSQPARCQPTGVRQRLSHRTSLRAVQVKAGQDRQSPLPRVGRKGPPRLAGALQLGGPSAFPSSVLGARAELPCASLHKQAARSQWSKFASLTPRKPPPSAPQSPRPSQPERAFGATGVGAKGVLARAVRLVVDGLETKTRPPILCDPDSFAAVFRARWCGRLLTADPPPSLRQFLLLSWRLCSPLRCELHRLRNATLVGSSKSLVPPSGSRLTRSSFSGRSPNASDGQLRSALLATPSRHASEILGSRCTQRSSWT